MPLSDSIKQRLKAQGYSQAQLNALNTAFNTGGEQAFTETYKTLKLRQPTQKTATPTTAIQTPVQSVVAEPTSSTAPAQTPTPTPTPTPTNPEVVQPQAPTTPTQEAPQAPVVTTPEPITPQVTPPTPQLTQAPSPVESAQTTTEVTPQRATQIQNNLEEGLKNAPQLFSTYEQYKEAYGYDNKSPGERAILEQFWNSKVGPQKTQEAVNTAMTSAPRDENQLFADLMNGLIVKSTPNESIAYNNAVKRVAKLKANKSLSYQQIAQKVTNGDISQQEIDDLNNVDPQLVRNAQALNAVNYKAPEILNNNGESKGALSAVEQVIADNPELFARVDTETINNAVYGSQGVQDAVAKLETASTDYLTKKSVFDSVEDEVRNELAGTGATESYIAARVASRRSKLYNELMLSRGEYETALQIHKSAIESATDAYKTVYTQNQQLAQTLLASAENQQQRIDRQNELLFTTQVEEQRIAAQRQYEIQREEAQREYETRQLQDTRSYNEKQLAKEREYEMLRLKDERAYEQAIAAGKPDIFESNGSTYVYRNGRAELLVGAPTQSTGTENILGTATPITREQAISQYGSTPAVRNFNPGNITDTGFGGYKVEGERFTRFNTPEEGFNALVAKIQNIQSGNSKVYSPEMTLLQYISKYAPSSDGNNPTAYANAVAKNLGITSSTKIKDIDPIALAKEHARHEDNKSFKMLNDLGLFSGNTPLANGQGVGNTNQNAEAMALIQGLGGTESERSTFAKNIVDRANQKGISLLEAKKELGYKSIDDKNFEESRKQQYTEASKSYSESVGNAKTALSLLSQPQTAIGDVASVVGFLKTIDPQSVARESEVQSVENARGAIDGLLNTFSKLKEGTKLTPTQRQQLTSAIQVIVDAQDKKFLEGVSNLENEFISRGLDPSVYIPKTYIDKARKLYNKQQPQQNSGAFLNQGVDYSNY